MIIAVNNRFSNSSEGEGYEQPMNTTLLALAQRNPQHQFLFIYDRPHPPGSELPSNARMIITGPETSSLLRTKYWLDYKLPRLLKKYNADMLINTDGCCSLRTKKPQCLLVNNLEFLDHPQGMKRSIAGYFQKNTQAFLDKAAIIATGSLYVREKLTENYRMDNRPVELVSPGIENLFGPLNWEQKDLIKDRFADGRSYFLCSTSVSTGNLVNLLKAFTLFKKRQKSSMLLLITGKPDAAFKKAFQTYRLRGEVKILDELSSGELAEVTGAAYAALHPVSYANIALPVIRAMRCAIPVMTSSTDALLTEFAGAVVFADPGNPNEMAENMMLLYKDEDLAGKLVTSGLQLASRFDADAAAEKLMQCINRVFNA